MSSSDGLRIDLIAAVFLLITKGAVVLGQAAGPNAVVSMNGQATLDCVVVQMAYTQWSRTLDGSSNPSTIAFGCSVIGSNSDYYSTEQPGGNVCRLIIGNATMQQAGVYNCYDGSSFTFRSLVTAIDPVANVVVYNQSEIVEDDHLNISCSVNYTGSSSPAPSIRPSPYFTSPGQSFTSLTYYPSANIVTVVATVQVQKPKVPIFWCNTVFEITGNTTGYNSTPPADNRTLGATTELDVEYCPGNISTTTTVSTADNCVYRKENLTCTADAYPEAQYEWLDLKNNSKTSGPVKSIEYGGKYQCIASNTIRSQPCSITANVTEYDCYAVMNMKITGPDCSNGSCNCTGKESIELVCLADSLPMPTYRWWSHVTQNNHQNISVTVDGNYSCIANNSFGSNSSEGIASISVVNCPPPWPWWYIVVIVVVLVVIVTVIAIVAYFCYRRKFSRPTVISDQASELEDLYKTWLLEDYKGKDTSLQAFVHLVKEKNKDEPILFAFELANLYMNWSQTLPKRDDISFQAFAKWKKEEYKGEPVVFASKLEDLYTTWLQDGPKENATSFQAFLKWMKEQNKEMPVVTAFALANEYITWCPKAPKTEDDSFHEFVTRMK